MSFAASRRTDKPRASGLIRTKCPGGRRALCSWSRGHPIPSSHGISHHVIHDITRQGCQDQSTGTHSHLPLTHTACSPGGHMGMGGAKERAYCGIFSPDVALAFMHNARPTKAKPTQKLFITSLLPREGAAGRRHRHNQSSAQGSGLDDTTSKLCSTQTASISFRGPALRSSFCTSSLASSVDPCGQINGYSRLSMIGSMPKKSLSTDSDVQ